MLTRELYVPRLIDSELLNAGVEAEELVTGQKRAQHSVDALSVLLEETTQKKQRGNLHNRVALGLCFQQSAHQVKIVYVQQKTDRVVEYR